MNDEQPFIFLELIAEMCNQVYTTLFKHDDPLCIVSIFVEHGNPIYVADDGQAFYIVTYTTTTSGWNAQLSMCMSQWEFLKLYRELRT